MSRGKIVAPEYLLLLREELYKQKGPLVFTNGVFDLLHPGHIHYLKKAAALGKYLMVALNSDESTRRIKGPKRPIINLEERMELLSALECVDFVTWFSEDTPARVIQLVHPDVLVKGGDWPVDQIAGRDFVESYGGKVISLPFLSGYSTTSIIHKILQLP